MISGKIIQGTTPTLSFLLPEQQKIIENIRVSFSQKRKLILSKEIDECVLDEQNKKILVTLGQEETYLFFQNRGNVTVTVKILFEDGEVIVSERKQFSVEDTADKAIIY